jgi:8-oxo-dGTP diphosphatase
MIEKYPKPAVTVDVVITALRDNELQVLLIKRDTEPYRGQWALPGGFVRLDEASATSAAASWMPK